MRFIDSAYLSYQRIRIWHRRDKGKSGFSEEFDYISRRELEHGMDKIKENEVFSEERNKEVKRVYVLRVFEYH